ncbi:MAG: chemotaxis protein CheB [Burkholderiaceae bacterium]
MSTPPTSLAAQRPLPRLHGRVDAVVIGGSAGAVHGLDALLPALPQPLAVPVFVVLHQPRDRGMAPNIFVRLFESRIAARLREPDDKEPVVPGTVYFAPADYHLLVDRERDGTAWISLAADEPLHFCRPSIDVLFDSAVRAYGPRLAAVLLSGANEDGADGLAAVHAAGGLAAVQQPGEALAAEMPQAALDRAEPDAVLPLAGLARWLRTLDAGSAP